MFWRDLDERVREHLSAAKREVVLVAPFIKAATLDRLLGAVPAAIAVRVFTRWRIEEIAAGVSDLAVLDLVEARPEAELSLCDHLHAKFYLADGTAALIGSANLTSAALGLSTRSNLEILQPMSLEKGTAALFLTELELHSRPATRLEAEALEAAAEILRAKSPDAPVPPDAQAVAQAPPPPWFPRFRSPDRLYALATDSDWVLQAAPDEPALHDLLALAPPLQGGEVAFDAYVRDALLASPSIIALEQFLWEPRRFGALTDWLRTIMPTASHEERQIAGQTLIRWLTYFAAEKFEISVPGSYSEVLRLRGGHG